MFRNLIIGCIFSLVLILGSDVRAGDNEESEKNLTQAENFTLKNLNGEEVSLSDFEGKVVILDFWATWCPPCVKEIPHFNELVKKYGEKGLVILGISVDQGGKDAVLKFKRKTDINYPVLIVNDKTYAKYQSYLPKDERGGIPFTFVLDRVGNIRNHFVGYRPLEVFVNVIEPLLTAN